MRILVFGAGVLGSLYAARLHDAGHDVTILARGERLAAIRSGGIVIRDEAAGLTSTSLVPAIERLDPADRYDAAFVFVRREQRSDAVAALAANATPTVVFMGNDATGGEPLREAFGARLVLGFPMAGGTIEGGSIVRARVARSTSPTMLGEPDGSVTERVRELAVVLASAGFRTDVTPAIGDWLRTHAAVVVPVAAAVYGADGDLRRLAVTPDLLLLAVRAVREGFDVLRGAGIPITPPVYARLVALPERLLTRILARAFATGAAELMIAGHARHARDEMVALEADLRELAQRGGVDTPALDRLRTWLDPTMEPLEAGSRTLVVGRPARAAAVGGATALGGIALGLVVLRRTRPDLVSRLPSTTAIAARLAGSPAFDVSAFRAAAFRAAAFRAAGSRTAVLRAAAFRAAVPHALALQEPVLHAPAVDVASLRGTVLRRLAERPALDDIRLPGVTLPSVGRAAATLPHLDIRAATAAAAASLGPRVTGDPARRRGAVGAALLVPLLLAAVVPLVLLLAPRRPRIDGDS